MLWYLTVKKIDDLFRELCSPSKQHIAILIDELRRFLLSGIVTMEDLIEEIMGDITDEYDEEAEQEIEKIADNVYLLDGAYFVG